MNHFHFSHTHTPKKTPLIVFQFKNTCYQRHIKDCLGDDGIYLHQSGDAYLTRATKLFPVPFGLYKAPPRYHNLYNFFLNLLFYFLFLHANICIYNLIDKQNLPMPNIIFILQEKSERT